MDNYEKGPTLGEGTFGRVFQARDKASGRLVAIKKIRMGKAKEGVNVTALREIKFLKELKHPNIIELVNVFPHKRNLNLVFEYMTSDLEAVIRDKNIRLKPADVKSYLKLILEGLSACHRYWIIHRDVKPNNILIGPDGQVKLADFGAGRIYGSPNDRKFTTQVFARWYRAPELLFGSRCYTSAVDMWAVGCVFAELMLRRAWLPGNSDIEQLSLIFHALGTPTAEQWPGMESLPGFVAFNPIAQPTQASLRQSFKCDADSIDLLQRLLCFDPSRRISAAEALKHSYFSNNPQATHYSKLPKPSNATKEKSLELLVTNGNILQPVQNEDGGNTHASTLEAVRRSSFPPIATKQRDTEECHQKSMSDLRPADRDKHMEKATPVTLDSDKIELVGERPKLGSADKAYLRKRKLDMDQAFLDEA